MGLMSAYSTDRPMTRAQLYGVPTPPPAGRFHRPIPFYETVDQVELELKNIGLRIATEEHIVGHEGNRHFGLLGLAPMEGELIKADDWDLFLALRGSHDQAVPRGIALGRRVMVCSNLMFGGDIATLSTKQTLYAGTRVRQMIREAVNLVPELAEAEERRVARMIDYQIKPRVGDAALIEIFRRGGLTAAQLGRAVQEWDRPTYDAHAEHGYNVFRLEQAVTEAAKPTGQTSNLFTLQDRVSRATSFINEAFELVA